MGLLLTADCGSCFRASDDAHGGVTVLEPLQAASVRTDGAPPDRRGVIKVLVGASNIGLSENLIVTCSPPVLGRSLRLIYVAQALLVLIARFALPG